MRRGNTGVGRRSGFRGFGARAAAPTLAQIIAAQAPTLALRADLGVTLGTPPAVATWADQSGNGNDFAQATVGSRPTYVAATLSGQDAIVFSAASTQFLFKVTGAWISGLTAGHVFVVLRRNADPPAASASAGLMRWGQAPANSSYPFTDSIIRDDFGSTTNQVAGGAAANLASQTRVYEVVTTATEWTNKIDGVQVFTTGTNTVAWDAAAPCIGLGGNARYMDGKIAEFLLFPSKRSAAQRAQIIAYLNARYALSVT